MLVDFPPRSAWRKVDEHPEAMMILPSRQISTSIEATPKEVYEFASNPANLPKWASGLSKSKMEKSGEDWIADSPMGQVKVHFAPRNEFGILDHNVTLPSGDVVYNPLRVFKNGDGSEVVFTLFRQNGVTDSDFEKDAAHVASDLATLKKVLVDFRSRGA